jgi:hypothetical protein
MTALRQTLTEAEKIQPARDIQEPERAGAGQLVAGVEIERSEGGSGVRARDIEKEEATDGDGR